VPGGILELFFQSFGFFNTSRTAFSSLSTTSFTFANASSTFSFLSSGKSFSAFCMDCTTSGNFFFNDLEHHTTPKLVSFSVPSLFFADSLDLTFSLSLNFVKTFSNPSLLLPRSEVLLSEFLLLKASVLSVVLLAVLSAVFSVVLLAVLSVVVGVVCCVVSCVICGVIGGVVGSVIGGVIGGVVGVVIIGVVGCITVVRIVVGFIGG